jgi:hypothetical protein
MVDPPSQFFMVLSSPFFKMKRYLICIPQSDCNFHTMCKFFYCRKWKLDSSLFPVFTLKSVPVGTIVENRYSYQWSLSRSVQMIHHVPCRPGQATGWKTPLHKKIYNRTTQKTLPKTMIPFTLF